MSELERLTLAATWIAAAVVAGLALSLVPNVEIMTLTVFAGGILLGERTGALIGFTAMILYVFANSAWRGFAPSPLPLLAAQAVGMACAGILGALWRRLWLLGGIPRRPVLWLLPLTGILAATLYQLAVNGVSARLFASGEEAYLKVFIAGMGFALVQIVANAVVFALLGPQVALTLRHMARKRGWWVVLIFVCLPGAGFSQDSPPLETSSSPAVSWYWERMQVPLWDSLGTSLDTGHARLSYLEERPILGLHSSRNAAALLVPTPERWGWGWGRTQFEYDGFPLNGPLHGFVEPPDIPMAFLGSWWEAWGATGTRLQLDAPPRLLRVPISELVLSTGSFARRTVEVALFRNLGPVNVGLNLADLEQASADFILAKADVTRFWFHLDSVLGKRPIWSLDWSTGRRDQDPLEDALYRHDVRRLQFSLRGPVGNGEARISVQGRRQVFSTQGKPGFRARGGLLAVDFQFSPQGQIRIQGNYDERTGIIDDASFRGVSIEGQMMRGLGSLMIGIEGGFTYQEPWGNSPEGRINVARKGDVWSWKVSVGTEAGAPPVVDLLDRPGAVQGMERYLKTVENLERPERTTAVRLEGQFRDHVWAGVWAGNQTGYVVQSNPLWAESGSDYRPDYEIASEATVVGVYGRLSVPLFWHLRAEGEGRVHNRDQAEIPYLPNWSAQGAVHFQRPMFKNSIDLDVALGGELWGQRVNPAQEMYEYAGIGHLTLKAAVENGSLFMRFFNVTANAPAADFRFIDSVTPFAVVGYHWVAGLNMHLTD